MIEVFKTNINDSFSAEKLKTELLKILPDSIINFDLEDCDKIMRIESETINKKNIVSAFKNYGYSCEPLPD
jgi:hypothetical protein